MTYSEPFINTTLHSPAGVHVPMGWSNLPALHSAVNPDPTKPPRHFNSQVQPSARGVSPVHGTLLSMFEPSGITRLESRHAACIDSAISSQDSVMSFQKNEPSGLHLVVPG
jgi:hypothetical protein